MKSIKRMGIWMDHSNAQLMELSGDSIKTSSIESLSKTHGIESSIIHNENLIHKKEQYQVSEYFKRLSEIILDYDEVVLFGPTDAKNELFNLLKDDNHFEKKRIGVMNADKMSEHQQEAFVQEYFNTSG